MPARLNDENSRIPVSIRMASSGHASTQNPQKTHLPRSMSKRCGTFSISGLGCSLATM
jgi:hypothetical protein